MLGRINKFWYLGDVEMFYFKFMSCLGYIWIMCFMGDCWSKVRFFIN